MTNRPLTPEELKKAPEWATHYWIRKSDDDVCFTSRNYYQFCNIKTGLRKRFSIQDGCWKDHGDTPIPTEPFNLELVEWYDNDIDDCFINGDCIYSILKLNCSMLIETKQDIINKAKALGLTAEDLK